MYMINSLIINNLNKTFWSVRGRRVDNRLQNPNIILFDRFGFYYGNNHSREKDG